MEMGNGNAVRRNFGNDNNESIQFAQFSTKRMEIEAGLSRSRQLKSSLLVEQNPLPIKTTLAAAAMLICGVAFLIAGLSVVLVRTTASKDGGVPMLVLGGICKASQSHSFVLHELNLCHLLLVLLPGSYASFIIYGAWMGKIFTFVAVYDCPVLV